MAVVYPFKKYNYKVTVGSLGDMGFSEISGGDISYEPIEYREGNYESSSPIKQQGIVKYGNVTLKYGLTASKALYDWLNSAQTATVKQEDVKIELLGDDHKPCLPPGRCRRRFPSSWHFPISVQPEMNWLWNPWISHVKRLSEGR